MSLQDELAKGAYIWQRALCRLFGHGRVQELTDRTHFCNRCCTFFHPRS